MTIAWRTTPQGYVEVDEGSGYTTPRHQLAPKTFNDIWRWKDLAIEKGAKYGVLPSWILAIIYRESKGIPGLQNLQGEPSWGLMQIHLPSHPDVTQEQMVVPELNVDKGASILAQAIKAGCVELPPASSYFNAGPGPGGKGAKTDNARPWGYVATGNYLPDVVAANNTFLDMLGGGGGHIEPPAPTPAGAGGGIWLALGLGIVVGYFAVQFVRAPRRWR